MVVDLARNIQDQLQLLDVFANNVDEETGPHLMKRLSDLPDFTTLNLGSNPNGAAQMMKGISQLLRAQHLTSLDLSSLFVPVDETSTPILCEAILECSSLTHLSLSGNDLGAGSYALGDVIRHSRTLLSLDLEAAGVPDEGACRIGEALQVNSTLTRLNLAHNGVDNDGFYELMMGVRYPHCKVNFLDLRNNDIESASDISERILPPNASLTRLDLSNNHLHDVLTLATGALQCKTLEVLELGGNVLRSAAFVKALGMELVSPNLRYLGLRGNLLGNVGGKELAGLLMDLRADLKTRQVPVHIDVRDNFVTDRKVADALNKALTQINAVCGQTARQNHRAEQSG